MMWIVYKGKEYKIYPEIDFLTYKKGPDGCPEIKQ